MKRFLQVALLTVFMLGLGMAPALAIPTLQLYIEGATYDPSTETWITTGSSFKLWVLGNVDGPGGTGGAGIMDVRLSAAFMTAETGSISISPSTTAVVTDPSTPSAPSIMMGLGADGTRPLLSDGSLLPSHGVYRAGVSFVQYSLGDFTMTDSPMGDFIGGFPGTLFPDTGQINVYDVVVTGYTKVHFDAFDTVVGDTHASFAPFSHDAELIPEPTSLLLLGLGLVGGAGVHLRRRTGRR